MWLHFWVTASRDILCFHSFLLHYAILSENDRAQTATRSTMRRHMGQTWSQFATWTQAQSIQAKLNRVTTSQLTPECEINTCCWRWGCLLHITIIAAAAKSLQSCSTLCNPIDDSPPGSPIPGILQARTLEWGAIASNSCLIYPTVVNQTRYALYTFLPSISLSFPPTFLCFIYSTSTATDSLSFLKYTKHVPS